MAARSALAAPSLYAGMIIGASGPAPVLAGTKPPASSKSDGRVKI